MEDACIRKRDNHFIIIHELSYKNLKQVQCELCDETKGFMKSIAELKKQTRKLSKESNIKLKDALELISQNQNSSSWREFRSKGDTFWYKKSSPFLNLWFSVYEEANKYQEKSGGYLLTYRGQYFIATESYVDFLGIDSRAEVWKKISFDVSPSNSFDKMYDYLKNNQKVSL